MRVELRQIASADVDDLSSYCPETGSAWLVQCDVMLAPEGSPLGGDLFQLEICSEAWLSKRLSTGPVFTGRYLVVREYNFAELLATIQREIDGAARRSKTWDRFACSLNLTMGWEFENYRETL